MSERSASPPTEAADAIGLVTSASSNQHAEDAAAIEAAERIGAGLFAPNAQAADQAAGPNRENMRALAEAGLLGMAVPRSYGGLDLSGAAQRAITEILASYCGVTTFTQAQHHGPCRMIYSAPNKDLTNRLLPDLAAGRRMCGVSFAHLRRSGPPVLRAEPVPGGYRLSGSAPWVTGWGLMDSVVFGATLPDDRFVYVWSPGNRADYPELFENAAPDHGDPGTLTASAPIPLCAMNASATVELRLERWFVPEAHRLFESDRETLRRNDRNGVLGATAMPVGCALGSLRLLRATAERRGIPAISRAAGAFERELADLRDQIACWSARSAEPDCFENAVRVRAWCIELGVRIAHAAVAATSGSANLLSHPAQRLLREAMFYTVQAQTTEVMDATLARLER